MKKLLLLFSLFGAFELQAQNITFTDPIFKAKLLQTEFPVAKDLSGNIALIDTDDDGEISITEAANVSVIDISYAEVTNLQGLEFFTNLKDFTAQTIALTDFNFPTLVALESLRLTSISNAGSLTNLDISANVNLKELDIYTSLVTALDLSNNVNLREITINGAALTTLNLDNLTQLRRLSYIGSLQTFDLSDCTNLLELTIGSYNLPSGATAFSSLDLSNQELLVNLNIGGTQITTLDLTNNSNLENIYVADNQLQTLNFGSLYYVRNLYCANNQLTTLNANSFQNLEVLSCENNQLTSLFLKNYRLEDYINFSNNPGLLDICCDPEQLVYIQNQALLNGNYDAVVRSDCATEELLANNSFASQKLGIYPNPAQTFVRLDSNDAIEQLQIYDNNGRLVQFEKEQDIKTIDVRLLQNGLYFIKTYTASGSQTTKLIKQ